MINKNISKAICTISAASIFSACNSGEKVSLMFQGQDKRFFLEVQDNSEDQWGNETVTNTDLPAALLIGDYNVGKSSLFNRICDKNSGVSGSGTSNTRFNFEAISRCGKFKLYDVPGFGHDHCFDDLAKIHSVASNQNINAILLVIDGTQNPHKIYNNFLELVNPFCDGTIEIKGHSLDKKVSNILEKLIIIFNKYDLVLQSSGTDHKEKIKNTIAKFKNEESKHDYVFYGCSDENKNLESYELFCKELSDRMYSLIKKRRGNKLDISLSNFLEYYKNLLSESDPKKEIEKFKNDIAKKLFEEYKDKFKEISKDSSLGEKENLYAEFLIFFKKELHDASFNFMNKSKVLQEIKSEDSLQRYYYNINMFALCADLHDQLINKLDNDVKEALYDNNNIKQLIRRCKNCTRVWVKVEGCVDNTYCGERPTHYQDKLTIFGKDEKEPLNEFATYIVGRDKETGKLFYRFNKKEKSLNDKVEKNIFRENKIQKSYYYIFILMLPILKIPQLISN